MSRRKPPKSKTNEVGEVVHAIKARNVVRPIWKRWVRLLDDADEQVGENLTGLIRADIQRREKQ